MADFVSHVRISGSRTMGEVMMPALVETFAQQRGYKAERRLRDDTHFEYSLRDATTDSELAVISFRVTSTAEGFADLLADEADLVLSTREVTPLEVRLGKEAGIGDLTVARRARIVGLDALVPIVARDNPIDGISLDDLGLLFAGEMDDWVELGWIGPITLHMRDNLSGLSEEFRRRVMRPMQLEISPDVVLHQDNVSLADAVFRDPNAIGIAPFSEVGNAKVLDIIGACGKRARATVFDLKTEDYPLTTPLFIYAPIGRPSPMAREFMSYVRSPRAQPVIARSGFVELHVGLVPLAWQGQRLANAILNAGGEVDLTELQRLSSAMEGTSRLTLSFRFEPGGSRLDAQSRSNIEVLGTQLELGRFDDQEITFVGFSDGDGPAAANLRLARRRADVVRKAVMHAAPAADWDRLSLEVSAFGEAMPMACDDSNWGKGINRRVEVWVK